MTPAQYDLHLHSFWSYDASASVEYYFEQAAKLKMKAIAITDHHNFDAVSDVRAASAKTGVGFIAGAELTVWSPLGTFDMVCLILIRFQI